MILTSKIVAAFPAFQDQTKIITIHEDGTIEVYDTILGYWEIISGIETKGGESRIVNKPIEGA